MLAEAEQELASLISRKKLVDKTLAQLEQKIYAFEGSYLEDTQQYGNIIRGFDGYLTSSRADKKKSKLNESDRLFSMSSATYQRSLDLKQRELERENSEEASGPGKADRYKKSTPLKRKKSTVTGSGDDTPLRKKNRRPQHSDED
ncbi:chromatin modification- protein eaf6 [Borealophlyctis nickersoniae]|nr:chromatin modification- protein eaf6 [Borealophlyctis nickersoniae]